MRGVGNPTYLKPLLQVERPPGVGLDNEHGPVLLFLRLESDEVLQLGLGQVKVGLGAADGRALALATEHIYSKIWFKVRYRFISVIWFYKCQVCNFL